MCTSAMYGFNMCCKKTNKIASLLILLRLDPRNRLQRSCERGCLCVAVVEGDCDWLRLREAEAT